MSSSQTRACNLTGKYLPSFMSGVCFYIVTMLLAQPGLEEHSTRHFKKRQTQNYAAKKQSDNHALLSETGMQSHSSIAGDFPSIFRVLQCYPFSHTSSPPSGCLLWHFWHRKGEGSCISFHGGVASISIWLVCEHMAELGAVDHFHLLIWLRERLRSDSELSHTCMHMVLTWEHHSHRSCSHCSCSLTHWMGSDNPSR